MRRLRGLPAKPPQFGNVRNAVPGIANPVFATRCQRQLIAGRGRHDLRKLQNRIALATADIENLIIRRGVFQREPVGARDIPDVDVIPELPAVLENARLPAGQHLQREDAEHPGVGVPK